MTKTLKFFIKSELEAFENLNTSIQTPFMRTEDLEGMAKAYDITLSQCLSYKVEDFDALGTKCDFVLNLIGRDYENEAQLERIRESISTDIKHLQNTFETPEPA